MQAINNIPIRPTFAVGLQFFDKDLIKTQPPDCPLPALLCGDQWVNFARDDPQHRPEVAAPYAVWVNKVETQATVIFIASCFLNTEFLSLWDIDANTRDRALIVPENGFRTADLKFGAMAWEAFSVALSNGGTVDEALTAANEACPACQVRYTFKRIGGTNANLRIVPR